MTEAVRTWVDKYGQRPYFRQLDTVVTRQMEDEFLRVVNEYDGHRFPRTGALVRRVALGRLRRSVSLEDVFCAELAAITYQRMGLLGSERPVNWYDPGKFWSGDRLELAPAPCSARRSRSSSDRPHPRAAARRQFVSDGQQLEHVHVGTQVGREPTDLVPGDEPSAEWTVEVARVDGDWRGKAVQGTRGERFLYLVWGNLPPGGVFHMFRRAKLMLDRIEPAVVREAEASGVLVADVVLTDAEGHPTCARRPPTRSVVRRLISGRARPRRRRLRPW